jgi:NADPH-dependent 2,4-dienoyl-CoA reductase/sulfur reductase-like enzyme
MLQYDYLIVGGGMTADSAVQGIRNSDTDGAIGVISAESNPPYDRPPLSKGLWTGDADFEDIWRSTQDLGVTLHLNQRAQTLDPEQKRVTTHDGTSFQYQQLLLATGCRPRRIPNDIPEVIYYRTLNDYQNLVRAVDTHDEFGVIGGGFIGSEIAAALTLQGKSVTMIFPDVGIGGRMFPKTVSQYLNTYYREQGAMIQAGEFVTSITKEAEHIQIQTRSGYTSTFDCVIAGIGVIPNNDLAYTAGLEVTNGIVVDRYLRTSQHDIFAAGDVANFPNPQLGTRMRVEHEDNANTMGDRAGRNMTGDLAAYDHLPSFYSDLFDVGYEAVGSFNVDADIIIDWHEEYQEGVIYYLSDQRIRGVMLWNVWDQVDAARALIAKPGPFTSKNVQGLLPTDIEDTST